MHIHQISRFGSNFYAKHNEWYWERFYHHTGGLETYKEAWEATEEEFFEKFGVPRYSSYESFRVAKFTRFNGRKRGGKTNQLSLF